MAEAHMHAAGVEISLRIGQRVRHRDYQDRRVTGVVNSLSIESERGLVASVVLDEPIVIPPISDGDQEIRIHWQTSAAYEFTPFDDRDELIAELLCALQETVSLIRRNAPDLSGKVIGHAVATIAKATGSAAHG